MLRSSNPILSKKDAFTPAAPQYGQSPATASRPYGYHQVPAAEYGQTHSRRPRGPDDLR